MPKGAISSFVESVEELLSAINIISWIAAILLFKTVPPLLASGLSMCDFGLRHTFDADSIAVINKSKTSDYPRLDRALMARVDLSASTGA